MNLMQLSLAFIVGFLLGGVAAYFAFTKFFSKHHLQDELTSTRRELANTKRTLNEFFISADSMFMQLDKNYRQFADLMAEAAGRISQNGDLFVLNRADKEALSKIKAAVQAAESANDDAAPAKTAPAVPAAEEKAAAQKEAASAKADKAQEVIEKEETDPATALQDPEPAAKSAAAEKAAPAPEAPAPEGAPAAEPAAPAPAAEKAEEESAAAAQEAEDALQQAAARSAALNNDDSDNGELQLTEPPKDFVVEDKAPAKI